MSVLPMTMDDLGAVVAIDLASFPEGARPHASAEREKSLREEFTRAWARLRVARDAAGSIQGYILFWHVADELQLLNVAVVSQARRKGLGRQLVEDMLTYGREHEAKKVLLEVRASNAPAIRLYESLGFHRFNVRAAYYSDGEDGVEMLLEL